MADRVEYYKISSGKNKGFAVVFGSWPARVMKHRGWTPDKFIFSRVATPDEQATIVASMRYQAMRYKDVDSLIEDETVVLSQWPDVLKRLTDVLVSSAYAVSSR